MTTEYLNRRTFCIVSHPDAGKTTLTEKLLLFGGAIQVAGTVKARKAARYATSDWMEIEKQRGISVTSSVLQFDFEGYRLNLLDTPGHKDFSEDTYRVITAVDAALMVIDGAKGIEDQTKKLLQICTQRKIPVITFINKLDRECRSPSDLLDEIERVLKLKPSPQTWPLRSGKSFKGIFDLNRNTFSPFESGVQRPEEIQTSGPNDARFETWLDPDHLEEFREQVDLAKGIYEPLDREAFQSGQLTPVFFGSAVNNFGIEPLLRQFCAISPGPQPRMAAERIVEPSEEQFSGFIFKIQANMDARHRDRIAFLRICSGEFKKGIEVLHVRNEKKIRLNSTFQFLASTRTQVEEAFAGDIVGLYDTGDLKIGDSLSQKEPLHFLGIPNFAPELFKKVVLTSPLKSKQLRRGLQQLCEEGASQVFFPQNSNDILVGVVGQLQFEVIQFRLDNEYGAGARFEVGPYRSARWVFAKKGEESKFDLAIQELSRSYDTLLCRDHNDRYSILVSSDYALQKAIERYPGLVFAATSEAILAG